MCIYIYNVPKWAYGARSLYKQFSALADPTARNTYTYIFLFHVLNYFNDLEK